MAGGSGGGNARRHNKASQQAAHNHSHASATTNGTTLSKLTSRYPTTVIILICITLAFVLVQFQAVWKTSRVDVELAQNMQKQHKKASPSTKKTGFQGIPTYDEYVQHAEENEWFPIDPLEKLQDSIRKLPQIFDLEAAKDIEEHSDKYLRMVLDELKFLLKVFAKSKDHPVDLTSSLFLTLEVMNQCFYRVMKHRITLNHPRLVTKDLVERLTRHWLQEPMKEFLTLKNANLSHIVIDTNHIHETKGYDALVRATQFRFYSLFSYFIASGSKRISMALHHAIINGDDLATALIVKLNSDVERSALKVHPSVTRQDIVLRAGEYLQHYQTAQQLHYHAIAERIAVALVHHVHYILRKYSLTNFNPQNLPSAVIAMVHQHIHHHFNSHLISLTSQMSTSERVEDILDENLELYYQALHDIQHSDIPDLEALLKAIPLHNAFVPTLHEALPPADASQNVCNGSRNSTGEDEMSSQSCNAGFEVENQSLNQGYVLRNVEASAEQDIVDSGKSIDTCQVDVVELASLSPTEFYEMYVMKNKPVLLQLPKSVLSSQMLKVWSPNDLKAKFADVQVWLSAIPYGSLFGEEESIWKFSQYVDYVQHFSEKILQHPTSKSAKDSYVWKDLHLTKYYEEAQKHASPDSNGIVPDHQQDTMSRLVDKHVKPLYLFGNDQQEITRMLKPMMSQYLQQTFSMPLQHNSSKSSTTSISTSLWDYIFKVSNYSKENHNVPNFLALPSRFAKYQFFYGAMLSGAPMHSHGPAFNILLHGEKLWTLLPPARDIYTSIHPLEWFATEFTKSKEYPYHPPQRQGEEDGDVEQAESLCELRQQRGQMLYVPRHYSHQVLNIGKNTIGFAVEVDDYIF